MEKVIAKPEFEFYLLTLRLNHATNHSVPRINHGNKRLNAVIKMMVGPSESVV